MPRFRKVDPEKESARLIAKADLASLGSQRNYQAALKGFIEFSRTLSGYDQDLRKAPDHLVESYLSIRSEYVTQKTLNMDRLAIQKVTGKTYPKVIAERPTGRLGAGSRTYLPAQVADIQTFMKPEQQLSVQIAWESGVRAHEILTLKPRGEDTASTHRFWSDQRFKGMDGVRYVVTGKGGLKREVMLSRETATQLEQRRLSTPLTRLDRKIRYITHYDVMGGKNLSNRFSEASQWAMGWSRGLHGLRHSYAQRRLQQLYDQGCSRADALLIISQELGHFRPEITEVYLR